MVPFSWRLQSPLGRTGSRARGSCKYRNRTFRRSCCEHGFYLGACLLVKTISNHPTARTTSNQRHLPAVPFTIRNTAKPDATCELPPQARHFHLRLRGVDFFFNASLLHYRCYDRSSLRRPQQHDARCHYRHPHRQHPSQHNALLLGSHFSIPLTCLHRLLDAMGGGDQPHRVSPYSGGLPCC